MDDRFNTIAGWALFSGIVALGLSSVSSMYFGADKSNRPDQLGYVIEGVELDEGEEEVPLGLLLANASAERGQTLYPRCASCHTIEQGGATGIGPNLWASLGSPVAGGEPGYAYSSALQDIGGQWTWEKMDDWLRSPKAFAPGTKMTFAGLSNPEDRAALMLYMNQQGSNLPLPEVPDIEELETGEDGEPGTGDTTGVSADPGAGAGPAGAETIDSPAAAGAVAQPAPKVQQGDKAVGNVRETQAN